MFDTHLDREHTRGWTNVRSLGANGEDEGDDTGPLVDALALGRPVILPQGVYRHRGLSLADGATLVGAGRDLTVLRYTGAGVALLAAANRVTVRDLTIDAAGATDGLKVQDSLFSRFKNLLVTGNPTRGVYLTSIVPNGFNGTAFNRFSDVDVENAVSPLVLDGGGNPPLTFCNGNIFSNVVLRTSVAAGGIVVTLLNSMENLFLGCDPTNYAGAGAPVAVDFQAGSHANKFVGGTIDSTPLAIGFRIAAGVVGLFLGVDNLAGIPVQDGSGSADHVIMSRAGGAPLAGRVGILLQGAGVPAAGLGFEGYFYFRNDTPGVANQRLYVKSAGVWVGIL